MTPVELAMSALVAGASGFAGYVFGYTSDSRASTRSLRAALHKMIEAPIVHREIMCRPGEVWRSRMGKRVDLTWQQDGIAGVDNTPDKYCVYTGRWRGFNGDIMTHPTPWDLVEKIQ